MELRTADAGRGAGWLFDGFDYFKRDAGAWIGVSLILIILFVVAHTIVIGVPVLMVLGPVFVGGLMLGCRAADEGKGFTAGSLFSGFSVNAGSLLGLGVVHLVASCIIYAAMAMLLIATIGLAPLVALVQESSGTEAGAIAGTMFGGLLMALLLGAALYVPVFMALWFAPALVVFRNASVMDALGQSFKGCLVNVVPFLLYGIIGLIFSFIASIPLGLGWLILAPMVFASVYIAYKEIFVAAPALEQAQR